MSRHDDEVSLREMLDYANEAVALIKGINYQEFENNRVIQLAVTRLIEIIGEAAKRISSNTQQEYDIIPWKEMIGMRNRLIHGYDIIDYNILWDTIKIDIPPLITELEKILEESD